MAPEPEPRPSAWTTVGFLVKLIASIAAPVVLVGVVLWWYIQADHIGGAVADRSAVVSELLGVAVDDQITSTGQRGVAVMDPAAVDAAIDATLAAVVGPNLHVRIVGLDGVVAYSTDPDEIGALMGMGEISPSALQGVPSGRMGGGASGTETVTYSVPVGIDGRTRAVARVVVADDVAIAAAAARGSDLRYPVGGAMALLIVFVTPLCWWSLGEVGRQFRRTRVLAMSDNLTGLANRTQFHQRLDEAIAAAQRANDRVGLVLLDLDGFKAINDRGGHAAGDRLLKRVAAALGEATRRNELACRLGGDEFAVIAPRIENDEELVALADRLHAKIDLAVDFSDGQKLRVTASLGLAMFPDDARNPDDLLNVADLGMYRVKAARKAKLPERTPAPAPAPTA